MERHTRRRRTTISHYAIWIDLYAATASFERRIVALCYAHAQYETHVYSSSSPFAIKSSRSAYVSLPSYAQKINSVAHQHINAHLLFREEVVNVWVSTPQPAASLCALACTTTLRLPTRVDCRCRERDRRRANLA